MTLSPLGQSILRKELVEKIKIHNGEAKRPKSEEISSLEEEGGGALFLERHLSSLCSAAREFSREKVRQNLRGITTICVQEKSNALVLRKVQDLYEEHFPAKQSVSYTQIALGLDALVAAHVVPETLQESFAETSASLKDFDCFYHLSIRLLLPRMRNPEKKEEWSKDLYCDYRNPAAWKVRVNLFFDFLLLRPLSMEEFKGNRESLRKLCETFSPPLEKVWRVYQGAYQKLLEGDDDIDLSVCEWLTDLFSIFMKHKKTEKVFAPFSFLAQGELALFVEAVSDLIERDKSREKTVLNLLSSWAIEQEKEGKKYEAAIGKMVLLWNQDSAKQEECLPLILSLLSKGRGHQSLSLLQLYQEGTREEGIRKNGTLAFQRAFLELDDLEEEDLQKTFTLFRAMSKSFGEKERLAILVHIQKLFLFHADLVYAEEASVEGYKLLYKTPFKDSYHRTSLFFLKAVLCSLTGEPDEALFLMGDLEEEIQKFSDLSFLARRLRQDCSTEEEEKGTEVEWGEEEKASLETLYFRLTSAGRKGDEES